MGNATQKEREAVQALLVDMMERVEKNYLDRETILAVTKALRDFGRKYVEAERFHFL
jgi:hypothetical protein